ncbi:hypothetical protein AB0L82_01500 [Nocardia sp. NPDC052001]|uniref:hypothetical protein n=1 Tax=Nocardia sp. NPDC052001 TaxID=3154853 RepID=UPI003434F77A
MRLGGSGNKTSIGIRVVGAAIAAALVSISLYFFVARWDSDSDRTSSYFAQSAVAVCLVTVLLSAWVARRKR